MSGNARRSLWYKTRAQPCSILLYMVAYYAQAPISNHTDALDFVLDFLNRNLSRSFHDEVQAVGHRVVHGMEVAQPVLLDDNIIRTIEHASRLAPLHNPPNLEGIYAAQKIFGSKPQARSLPPPP